jgi:hypothetical protein
MTFYNIIYDGEKHDFQELYRWLKKNCQGKFYTGNPWGNIPMKQLVQFELEKDAVLFSLKFQ